MGFGSLGEETKQKTFSGRSSIERRGVGSGGERQLSCLKYVREEKNKLKKGKGKKKENNFY